MLKFVHNKIKDEIRHIISGNGEVGSGANIQATANYLRKSTRASHEAKASKHYKLEEEGRLRDYITKNKLWVTDSSITRKHLSQGCESIVYLLNDKYVVKVNCGFYYVSWEDFLYSLLLHNYFFPNTKYELLGFVEENDRLSAVVKQPYVEENEGTDMDDLKKFMRSNGFIQVKNNNYDNHSLGLRIEDLHNENVLTKNGVLQFIDTVFYIMDKEFYFGKKKKFEHGGEIYSNSFDVFEIIFGFKI